MTVVLCHFCSLTVRCCCAAGLSARLDGCYSMEANRVACGDAPYGSSSRLQWLCPKSREKMIGASSICVDQLRGPCLLLAEWCRLCFRKCDCLASAELWMHSTARSGYLCP